MIIVVLYKSIQRAVDGVVLAGLDLDGDGGETVVIVDQIIDLSLAAVIVIKQLEAVGRQLLGHHAFIHRAEIDPRLIVQDRTDIAAVQNVRQKPHVVQIELEQVFADGLRKGKDRGGDCVDVQGDPRRNQIFKFILIVGKNACRACPRYPERPPVSSCSPDWRGSYRRSCGSSASCCCPPRTSTRHQHRTRGYPDGSS